MHSTIGAFSAGVPVVPMAYSRKFNGLFVDTLKYDAMADMKASTDEETLDIIKTAFSNREHLKEIIKSRMTGVVAERKAMLMNELKTFFDLK